MDINKLIRIIKEAENSKIQSLALVFKSIKKLPPEIGQLAFLRSLDLHFNALSQLPPEIGQLTSLQVLALSTNEIDDLPPEIGQLTSLQSLDLGSNKLSYLPSEIGQLTSLQSLNLGNNKLSYLPSEIGQLASLQSLNLGNNKLSYLPSEIRQLSSLKYLSVGGNQFENLPSQIAYFPFLKALSISGDQLEFLPEIAQLPFLQSLFISGIQPISQLPPEIGQFTSLQSLNLSGSYLSQLPPEIGQLISLQSLSLRENQLSQLPPEIGQLTSLQFLDLSGNQIYKLPPEIGQITSLQSLDLSINQLSQLPSEIGQLVNLNFLDISVNKLKELPPEILHIPKVNYGTNELKSIPPEIRKKKWNAVRKFLKQQLEKGIDRIYEAKLLIVGEGGAGKTTLAKKIENEKYELVPTEQSTEGIDIIRWTFPLKDNRKFIVNIWDFGGQEIYHTTHQFFLTKRSLYILVADSRKEDTDFFYWLNVVDLLSKTSPILIIKNEKQDRKREIDERQLRGEFLNLKEVLSSNLADNRGLSEIKQAIEHYIISLSHIGDTLPKTWIDVRKALETNPHNYITLEKYLEICQENGFEDYEDKMQLSDYLHDLGVCLHFQEDDLLRKTVILKPTWGTDAVYRVLDNPKIIQNLGHFNRDDIAEIWHEEQYATMRPELLRLMMNFKLCYEIPSSPNHYIAPQLLSLNSPEYTWDDTDNLLLRYSYEFMPKGIITRFIVEMHEWIENQTCVWKTGVILNKDKARAEVIELYHRNEIRIRVCGDRRRDILTTVRYELDKIHNSYERLKYNTLVPCNCKTCKGSQHPHFYIYDKLIERISNNKKTIECGNPPYYDVKISGLIDDIEPTIFFSDRPEKRDQNRNLKYIQSILSKTMSNDKSISISGGVFHSEVLNLGENSGGITVNKYTSDRDLAESLDAIAQTFKELSQIYATTDEQEIEGIIEAEIEKIKERNPNRWQTLKRQFLNPKRWLSGGRAAAIEIVNHYVDESAWGKGIIAFLDKVSEEG